MKFEWDEKKNKTNIEKHGVDFEDAQEAFFDPKRIILEDTHHSTQKEKRYFCFGKLNNGIATVRFVTRNGKIRIFGAGFWRKGKKYYEQRHKIH